MDVRATAILWLAGIVVWGVGSERLAQPADWTLREELRMGGNAGSADDIPLATRVLVGRDGEVYVLSPLGGVTVFDRSGRVIRRVRIPDSLVVASLREEAVSALGRARDGLSPAEEAAAVRPQIWSAMGWLGDTLWIIDRSTPRVVLSGPRGDSVGAIPISRDVEGGRAAAVVAVLADRSLLRRLVPENPTPGAPLPPPSAPPDRYRMPIIPGPSTPDDGQPLQGFLVRTAPDGRILQGLEVFVEPRPPIVVRGPYGSARIPYPFQDRPLIGGTADGREVVFVERYAATRPGPARYSIARFDVETGKRSARFHEYTPAPVTERTIDSLLTRFVDFARSGEPRRFAQLLPTVEAAKASLRAALDLPAFHTPVTGMVVGEDRTVWLREWATGRWVAHTPDGRTPGRVALPAATGLVHADGDVIWAVRNIPGQGPGAQVLVRYRIVRP